LPGLRPAQHFTTLVERHEMAPRSVRQVVSKILEDMPGSIRALSRESGVDHATLLKVRDGELGLSQEAAESIISALRRWGKTCNRLADQLETATRKRR